MSERPRDLHHLNATASNELHRQAKKAGPVLERLAAQLAATERLRGDVPDLVLPEHVRRAAKILFQMPSSAVLAKPIFLSCSRAEDAFIDELTQTLANESLAYFESRHVKTGARWGKVICEAIRGCEVFLSVVTPRFLKSSWFTTEAGAALGAKKRMFLALRNVDAEQLPSPFNEFQTQRLENASQLKALIADLRRYTRPTRRK